MSKKFMERDEVKTELTFKQMFIKLWPFMRPYKGTFTLIFAIVIAFTALGRALPLLFGYAIDEGIKKENITIVYFVAIAYLIAEISRSGLAFFQSYLSHKFGNRVLYDIREKLIDHVQRLKINYFDKNPVGRTVTRVTNDISSLGELFSQGFTSVFVNVFEVLSIVVAMLFVSPTLTAATIFVAPLIVWLTAGISRRIRRRFREAKAKLAQINAHTAESINGIKILQLYNRSGYSREKFSHLSEDYKGIQLKTVHLFAILWPVFNLFNATTVATAIFLGGVFRSELGMSIGQLSAFVLLIQSFFKPIRGILERYNQFQNSLASADRIFNLLDEEEETGRVTLTNEGRLRGAVEYRNLTFAYSKEAGPILKNVSLKIKPGESVALVGRTGSGKTTMISLLQKLYDYEHGEILVDGQPIKEMAPQSLRSRIGVVQQDNFIFRGTVASNISLDNPNIDQAGILAAAHRANCDKIIDRQGLDGKVEERGANLSVGERQLIAFARVLAFDPDILILDEATANIDSQSEKLIKEATEKVTTGRTSLIIAHRLSTIMNCDRIVLLDKGCIIEQGTHNELLRNKGPYWNLFQAQYYGKQKKNFDKNISLETL